MRCSVLSWYFHGVSIQARKRSDTGDRGYKNVTPSKPTTYGGNVVTRNYTRNVVADLPALGCVDHQGSTAGGPFKYFWAVVFGFSTARGAFVLSTRKATRTNRYR